MVENTEAKTIAIFNKGSRPFIYDRDNAKGLHGTKTLEPMKQAVMPEEIATKLLKMYPMELIKVCDIPATNVDMIAQIKDRDEKIVALKAAVALLETKIAAMEAADAEKETKEIPGDKPQE